MLELLLLILVSKDALEFKYELESILILELLLLILVSNEALEFK